MRTLIIGKGEIGKSLESIFSKYYPTYIRDIDGHSKDSFEIIHICFPYSEYFINQVNTYKKMYNPKHIVIHSTVPVGTSRKLDATHSPCVGIHPHLGESLKIFTKFLGGEHASDVAQYFRRAGIKVTLTDNQESTELMKIMSTSYYGLCIEYTKEVKRLCDENNVPFELWTLWTDNYNNGYEKLGYPEYRRPNLTPIIKKIGGHCILTNLKLIKSKFTKFIDELND